MKLWGKIKRKHLLELFGDLRHAAASVPLVPPPAPKLPARADAPTTMLDQVMHAQLGLPTIDFDSLIAKLPTIPLRDWTPRAAEPAVSYLAFANIDATASIELVERICGSTTRSNLR